MGVDMTSRFLALLGLLAFACLASQPAASQTPAPAAHSEGSAEAGSVPRTPWGHPDLQGIWTTDVEQGVPIERPVAFGDRAMLNEKELAARDEELKKRARDDPQDRVDLGKVTGAGSKVQSGDGPEHWYEMGKVISPRTSLITDPPNGRIPPYTPEGQKRLAQQNDKGSFRNGSTGPWDGPEDLDLRDRCITRGFPRTLFPSAYNNGFQIVQNPDSVVVFYERLHEARVIPLDGRPHPSPRVREYMGDSRGHWEGDTLVVDIANFSDKSEFYGSSENLHVTERYTRVNDSIKVEFTVNDPTTWTKPWTAAVTGLKDPAYWQIFEYACHEGNYGMRNILSGARAQDKAAAKAAKPKR
jgi:hypothetical protein